MDEQTIFTAALERQPGDRAEFLDEACGQNSELRRRVEQLLRLHDDAGSFLKRPHDRIASPTVEMPIVEKTGSQIGPYKLLQELGEGGMGVVFMAEQKQPVKRRVALKIIKPGMDTQQVVARFEAERQALALMDHPNIAKVLDAGATDNGRPYFVMELVNGISIVKYCDQQHLTPKERLELFVPVCKAVQHAHQKGIIHRDLKPSNVLVALYDGQAVPKVIDFGIAKATGQSLTEKTMFTQLGQVVGTLEYMSPEQAQRNQLDIDTRSDVYSLGVLLYELLTGDTPFDRKRLRSAAFEELLRIIREEDPPKPSTRLSSNISLDEIAANRRVEPARLSALVRGDLDWIVMKAMEKDRARRYETANKLADDIHHYLHDEPVVACPPSAIYKLHKFARRNKALLATVFFIAATMLVASVISTWSAIRTSRALVQVEQQRNEKELARQQAVSKQQEAQTARREADHARQEADHARQEADHARGEAVRRAALARNRLMVLNAEPLFRRKPYESLLTLREIPADTDPTTASRAILTAHKALQHSSFLTERRLLGHSGPVWSVAWSPDGKRIVTASEDNTARVWNADGIGEPIVLNGHTGEVGIDDGTGGELVIPDGHFYYYGLAVAAWSPDGKRIAMGSEDGTARVWNAAGKGNSIVLAGHTARVWIVAWSPDGKRVVTASWDGTARVWNADGTGTPIILSGHTGELWSAAWSPDGQHIVTTSKDNTARVWNADGTGKAIVITGHTGPVWSAAWSPDGKRIATASNDRTARLWNADGTGEPFVLAGHKGPVRDVEWSPDGKRVATATWVDKTRVWNADGTGDAIILAGSSANNATWSPDGTRIVTTSNRSNSASVWNADGTGKPIVLAGHTDEVWSAAWSPEGKRIVTASADGSARIWNVDASGQPIALSGHKSKVIHHAWSPDGQRIATTSQDGTARVWNADGTGDPIVLAGHKGWVGYVTWSPDSKRIVTTSLDDTARAWNADGTGDPIVLDGYSGDVHFAAWSPDGKRILTASVDNTARVWNADGTGDPVILHGLPGGEYIGVWSAAWSPDGKSIVMASTDGKAQIWNADGTGEPIVLTGHMSSQGVESVAWSPDGKRIVTASDDDTARVWNADGSGAPIVLAGHTGGLWTAAWSPDSKRIVTASEDHSARVWNADGSGVPIVLSGHAGIVRVAVWSLDGQRIVTDSKDGTARVWNADGTGVPISFPCWSAVNHPDDFHVHAALSPDGKRIVTGSWDARAWVWTVKNWPELRESLWDRNSDKFTVKERIEYLGETPEEAKAAVAE